MDCLLGNIIDMVSGRHLLAGVAVAWALKRLRREGGQLSANRALKQIPDPAVPRAYGRARIVLTCLVKRQQHQRKAQLHWLAHARHHCLPVNLLRNLLTRLSFRLMMFLLQSDSQGSFIVDQSHVYSRLCKQEPKQLEGIAACIVASHACKGK